MGNIKLRATERNAREPLVIIGGPCATFNPEPLAAVADAFVIGEGEDTVQRILDVVYAASSKAERLTQLAQLPGVYVPSFYEAQYDENGSFARLAVREGCTAPTTIKRQWVREIDNYPHTTAIMRSSWRGRGLRKQYPAMQKRQCRPQPRATSTMYISSNSVPLDIIAVV